VLILGVPFFFFVLFFPTEVLLIVSGTQYLPAKVSLQILAIVPLIIGLCNVFGTQYLLAIGLERKILFATIFGFVVSLSLNFGLIPFYGYIGSAIACFCSELTVCLVVFYHARKTIKVNFDYVVFFLILSSILVAFVFWLVLHTVLNHFYLMFATSFCYLIAFLLLHFFVFKSHFINQILSFRNNKQA
jgi:O-antigen/teichoic acid export membrane protein